MALVLLGLAAGPGCRSMGIGLTEADFRAVGEPFVHAIVEKEYLNAWNLGTNEFKLRYGSINNFTVFNESVRVNRGAFLSWSLRVLTADPEALHRLPLPDSVPQRPRRAWLTATVVHEQDDQGNVLLWSELHILVVEDLGSLHVGYIEYTDPTGPLSRPTS